MHTLAVKLAAEEGEMAADGVVMKVAMEHLVAVWVVTAVGVGVKAVVVVMGVAMVMGVGVKATGVGVEAKAAGVGVEATRRARALVEVAALRCAAGQPQARGQTHSAPATMTCCTGWGRFAKLLQRPD